MPAVQVTCLYTFQKYERFRDDFFKWTSVPYYQGYQGMDAAVSASGVQTNQDILFKLFTMSIPAVRSCGLAAARSERHLDAIQCIEAIRLYSSLHGKLPSRLEDLTDAPVPLDAGTGKPFEYEVHGERATLSAPSPSGAGNIPQYRIKYELTLTR
jgi:hypothetical protein